MRTPSKQVLLLAAALMVQLAAAAQFDPTAQGAREGALGGVVLFDRPGRGVSLDWCRGWMQAELADKGLRMQLPIGARSTLRTAYVHHGNSDYHTQQLAASYALCVNEWLRVGVAARYLHLGTSDARYEPQQWLAPSAAVQATVGRTTLMLLAGTRPWDERSPWRMHLQAAYRPTDRWMAVAEVEREDRLRVRCGVELAVDRRLRLRAGMATRPTLLTFGAGFRLAQWEIDLAAQVHGALGVTPQISVALWF